jgi:hypothetical protein
VQLRTCPSETSARIEVASAAMRAIGLDRPARRAGHSVSVGMTSSILFVPNATDGTCTARAETGHSPRPACRACSPFALWGMLPDSEAPAEPHAACATGRPLTPFRLAQSENRSPREFAVLELVRAGDVGVPAKPRKGERAAAVLLTSLSIGFGIYLGVLAGFLGWWARFPR